MLFEGGFCAVKQNPETLALKAVINWNVCQNFKIPQGEFSSRPVWMEKFFDNEEDSLEDLKNFYAL